MKSSALPRTIWYMGAKARVIPGFLDRVLERLLPPGGTVLDLFSGSGVVASFCSRRYRVITNDAQRYAQLIARSFIERPPGGGEAFARSLSIDRDLLPAYRENRERLERIYAPALRLEDLLLEEYAGGPGKGAAAARLAERYRDFLRLPGGLHGGPEGETGREPDPIYRRAALLVGERTLLRYRKDPGRLPACLITAYYSNIYYGLRQAIELDSLRGAIRALSGRERERNRVHYLSALVHAASVSTSGTSHFAQPRQLRKDSELEAMARRRRIDVLSTFRRFSEEIAASLASGTLHRENRCLCGDYRDLIRENGKGPEWKPEARADLVYMDPPYTADNYSRFYHVLETLVRYDYPPLELGARGRPLAGRYPEIGRRFQSRFCRAGTVEEEFERVIAAAANSGSKLVISYASPSGLLLKVYRRRRAGGDPVRALEGLCRVRYRSVETRRLALTHSGQGDKNLRTQELLVACEGPR